MPKGFQKGNKFAARPSPKGSPGAKLATFREPFTTEQAQYVSQLLEFQNIDHWFPYTARELPPGFTHLATIAKVMMISAKRHQSIIESHPRLSHRQGQRLEHHLRELGFSRISEKNVEQRSIGGNKVMWVNLHDSPTLCPKETLLQTNTDTVLHLTRKTEMLNRETEIPALREACAQFAAAWRENYSDRDRMLTVKGHIVEAHVADFVEHYGTAGVFGEDGAEAIHVSDAACRRIVRQMRNPVERHKAAMLHHIAYQFTPALKRDIKKRKRNGDAVDDALAALGDAAAAATAATELLVLPGPPELEEGAAAAIADVWSPV